MNHPIKFDCVKVDLFLFPFVPTDIAVQKPLFKDNSYIATPKTYIRMTTDITVHFKPAKDSGILFYTAFNDQSEQGDFLSLILNGG